LLALASFGSVAASADLVFDAPYLTWDVGVAPGALTVGDLNGDGRPDAVVTNVCTNTISVLMGKGSWTFQPRVSYSTGVHPSFVAMADLDANGAADLVVANLSANSISVYRGMGNGVFGARSDFGTGSGPDFVSIGDLSGDGRPDLAVTNGAANTVSVLIGNSGGSFATKIDYPAGNGPTSVAIGDLDRDGIPDLAVTARTSGIVSIFLGRGGGVFGPANSTRAVSFPTEVRIADLNGDGNPDLVVASATTVSVFAGDGSGVFATPTQYPSNGGSLALGDLDGDGNTDLVSSGSRTAVLPGHGDGSFGDASEYLPGGTTPAIADLNNDGKLDLMVANPVPQDNPTCPQGVVSMIPGHGDGSFGSPAALLGTGVAPLFVTSHDLDGDGVLDLVVANSGANTLSVLRGLGDGSFAAKEDFPTGLVPCSVAIGDVNRDGTPDLVATNRTSNTVSVLLGSPGGQFRAKTDYATGAGPGSVATGDLNRDGSPDLVVANNYWGRTVSVLLGRGDGTFAPKVDYLVMYLSFDHPSSVTLGDLNADGVLDLVVTIVGELDFHSENQILVLAGVGDGTFANGKFLAVGLNPSCAAIGDVNHDGKPDLVVANGGDWAGYPPTYRGSIYVLAGRGDGSFTSLGGYIVGDYPTAVAIEDFDGDGRPDLAVANSHSSWISVLPGIGAGLFGAKTDYATPGTAVSLVSGDLDADGKPDLAVALGSANQLVVMRNLTPDWPTPTLISDFHGEWTARGVELRWVFGAPGGFTRVDVQRGESVAGPWFAVEGARREEAGASLLLDPTARPGRIYLYRLVAATPEGASLVFGPLEVTAGSSTSEYALHPVAPNPGQDRVRIGFSVPARSRVRLEVIDVQGRRVALLVDEVRESGRHEVAWVGSGERGRVAAGLYFVRLEAGGRHWVRRFVWTR
jgi:hypothetical protein